MRWQLDRLTQVGAQLWDRYGSDSKHRNALRLEQLRRECAEVVDASPWRVILDPISICNLRCIDCGSQSGTLPHVILQPENVDRFLGDLWPNLVQVNLFHWGEPFLNTQIDRIVKSIHDRGVGTQIHSNFNRMPEDMPQRVIEAGLDFIVASIDGATQKTYEQYRCGGQISVALANLRRFVDAKRKLGARNPKIIWRYLCFEHTMGEIEAAREMAREMGVDDFALGEGALHGQVWTPNGPRSLLSGGANVVPESSLPICEDVYDFPAIHPDGKLLPCCYVSQSQFAFGDLMHQNWAEAFNTEPFRRARRMAAGNHAMNSACADCFKMAAARRKKMAAA